MSFLRVPPFPRSARSPGLHPSMLFVVGSFIPVLHCGPFRHLFSNVPPFGLLHVYRGISFMPVSCTAGNLLSGCGHLPRSTVSVGPRFPEDVPLAPCHCCTAGRLPAGGSQLLPGSTISSGQLLRLSMSPCSLLPAPMPPFPSSDRYYCGFFPRVRVTKITGSRSDDWIY
jgi:hypothetical protein